MKTSIPKLNLFAIVGLVSLSPSRFGGQRDKIVNSTKTKTEVNKWEVPDRRIHGNSR